MYSTVWYCLFWIAQKWLLKISEHTNTQPLTVCCLKTAVGLYNFLSSSSTTTTTTNTVPQRVNPWQRYFFMLTPPSSNQRWVQAQSRALCCTAGRGWLACHTLLQAGQLAVSGATVMSVCWCICSSDRLFMLSVLSIIYYVYFCLQICWCSCQLCCYCQSPCWTVKGQNFWRWVYVSFCMCVCVCVCWPV